MNEIYIKNSNENYFGKYNEGGYAKAISGFFGQDWADKYLFQTPPVSKTFQTPPSDNEYVSTVYTENVIDTYERIRKNEEFLDKCFPSHQTKYNKIEKVFITFETSMPQEGEPTTPVSYKGMSISKFFNTKVHYY